MQQLPIKKDEGFSYDGTLYVSFDYALKAYLKKMCVMHEGVLGSWAIDIERFEANLPIINKLFEERKKYVFNNSTSSQSTR